MITAYKDSDGKVIQVTEWAKGCWVSVVDPQPKELDQVQKELDIPREFLDHSLDRDELARIEKEDGQTLVILRLPHHEDRAADVPYTVVPIGIILTRGLVVTVCPVDSHVIQSLAKGEAPEFVTDNANRFLLELLYVTADRYLKYVREINKIVNELEDKLQRSLRNQEVLELLKYQKSLTFFATGLKSNVHMLDRLSESHLFEKSENDRDLLADVKTEIQQAIEMIDISGNILSQLMDAFASIISNNLNLVMKFLASMTIILTIPTVLSSLYGMNVRLPLEDQPQAFGIIVGVSVVLAVITAVFFWKKGWF